MAPAFQAFAGPGYCMVVIEARTSQAKFSCAFFAAAKHRT